MCKLNLGINLPKSADLSQCKRMIHILNLQLAYTLLLLYIRLSVEEYLKSEYIGNHFLCN